MTSPKPLVRVLPITLSANLLLACVVRMLKITLLSVETIFTTDINDRMIPLFSV